MDYTPHIGIIPEARMDGETIKRVIRLGHETGFVTFDQLNELLPPATTAPEDIEDLMHALSEAGINLVEQGP